MPSRRAAFGLLALCVVAASWPALRGGWVYDDRLMVGHPMLDGLEDVVPAFGRTSHDYMARTQLGPAIAGGSTYRPLAMVSFILVNGTVGARPLAHHLVSLACHLGVIWLLLGLAGRLGWRALFVVTVFALHPASLETYGWINARADALGGLALAGVIALEGRPRRWPWLFLVLLLGALSKETFLVAAGVVVLARRLRPWQPRALLADLGAVVLAGVALFGLRLAAGAGVAVSAGSGSLLALVARAPRVVGLAVETWLAPWPHAMRLLAWETIQPFPASQVVAAALPLVAAGVLAVRGELRRAALLAGAVVCIVPAVLVTTSFWLGFDRYLYMPALLVVAAALPLAGGGRAWAVAAPVAGLALGAATFVCAQAYRSHTDFALAVLADRPDEPTGWLLAADDALDRGRPADAAELMDHLPAGDWPPSVAHHLAGTLLRLGRGPAAAAVVERAAAAHPDDGNLRFDLLTVRAAQHRWPDVVALARDLAADPARRRAISDLVVGWSTAGELSPSVRAELETLLGPDSKP